MFNLTIRLRIFLGLMLAVVLFLVAINIALQVFLKDIANKEILQGLQRSVTSYQRFDEQRTELLLSQARSIAQVVHLKATLTIPDVDTATVHFAASSISEIIEMPLLLIINGKGMLMADTHDNTLVDTDLSLMPGMSAAVEGQEFSGHWQYRGSFYHVAIIPVVVADQIVGLVATGHSINEPGTELQIEELSGSAALLTFEDQLFLASLAEHLESQGQPGVQSLISDSGPASPVARSENHDIIFHESAEQSYFSVSIPHGDIPGHVILYRDAYLMPGLTDPFQLTLLLSSTIVLLYGVLLSASTSARISRPILALTEASKQYSMGNFEHRVQNEHVDEIAVLADGMNSMAGELQLNQEALVASKEEAESANRAKTTFLSNMSHEFRTPLNGVLGMAELLVHTTDLSSKQKHYVNTISDSGKNLLEIIGAVLDHSRMEAGNRQLVSNAFNLKTFAEDTCAIHVQEVQQKELNFARNISADASMEVIGDKALLGQIIAHLMSNAIRFTETGGIEIGVDIIDQQSGFAKIQFSVVDTGIGIEEDKFQTIFKPFRQADDSTSRKYGGAGLGLAISKQLVELMDGSIQVDSTFGEGSAFYFDVTLGLKSA